MSARGVLTLLVASAIFAFAAGLPQSAHLAARVIGALPLSC